MRIAKYYNLFRIVLSMLGMNCSQMAMAKCGSVDYSWGADGLAQAHDFIITMLLYTVYLCYAIAGIVAVIASLQIYIKMNVGEEGIKKEIIMVVGAILFIIAASIVMPAMFGYQI
jgi:uncharacterized membrane protein